MKKSIIFPLCAMTCLIPIVGSYAYFSDKVETKSVATAGSVDIVLDTTVGNETDKIGIDLPDTCGKDNLNPGDMRQASFSVQNLGNKSVDIRTTIFLTSTVPFDFYSEQSEFELYHKNDVEEVSGKGYRPKEGAKPIQKKSISTDGLNIIYEIPEFVLNGNMTLEEKETEDGITSDKYLYDYVLLFKKDITNEFQATDFSMSILVEAKQHRNTAAGWHLINKNPIKVGGMNMDVVDKNMKGVSE